MKARGARPFVCGLGIAALLAWSGEAQAVGWAGTGASSPVEERLALSVSPVRSALFTQLRVQSEGGPFAVVVPVREGAALDWSSRAFFEGLEVATAPRVVAPASLKAKCGDDAAHYVYGDIDGSVPLEPVEIALLDSAAAVEPWLTERGLSASPALLASLTGSTDGLHFFVARYDAPEGESLTRTLRVVDASPVPTYPLGITGAGAEPLSVVTWTIGTRRGSITGMPLTLDDSALSLKASEPSSNYEKLLWQAFDDATDGYVLQMSSHESLRDDLSLQEEGPTVEGFIHAYFERAAAYGDAIDTPSLCITQAAAVLDQSLHVGTACPRSVLGVVGNGEACTADAFETSQVDPGLLRCGPDVDDLAVLLSDLEPDEAWITRATIAIPPLGTGSDRDISFPRGDRIDPGIEASAVDLGGCPSTDGEGGGGGEGGNGTPSHSSGNGNGSGDGSVDVPIYVNDGCDCSGGYELVGSISEDESTAPDAYYVDDCDADSAGTYQDDCSGGDTYEGDYFDEGCGCDDVGSGEYVEDGCGCSETGIDWTEDEGCDCSGTEGGDFCEGDAGAGADCDLDCTVKPKAKKRPRRLNGIVYTAVALIVPLRRWGRKKPVAAKKPAPKR